MAATAEHGGPVHVLCLASEDLRRQGLDGIDPKAVNAYRDLGFELHFDFYQRIDEERLRCFPVVVGMMPMLFPGTRAIDDRVGDAIDRYVKEGGGFLLMPAPGYYAGEDFLRQLNPWLARFGCTLVNDHPRDPTNEKTIVKILGYRYLRAGDAWLPLDVTDAYVSTHTMRLSDEWQVLLRGADTCRSLTFGKERPGAYASAPPFLATRPWGEGKIAVFATSSQYFIFDAYHKAYDDGFVMREGGARLMQRLLLELATRKLPPPPRPERADVVEGNVPVFPDRNDWFEHVRTRLMPPGFGVARYVDCGSLADVPWDEPRGSGYVGKESWPVRWNWAEEFHATAANARAFSRKPLVYRFDGLDDGKSRRLGLLVWGYQAEGSRSVRIEAEGRLLSEKVALPRFADGQGPSFITVELPPTQGSLEVSVSMAEGGNGSFSSLCELWVFEEGLAFRVPNPLPTAVHETYADRRPFRGVIDASGNVADVASAARAEGHDFIVCLKATDAVGDLEAYRRECAAASGKGFIAIPGVSFAQRSTGKSLPAGPRGETDVGYVLRGLSSLPENDAGALPAQLPWRLFSGEFSRGKSAPLTLWRSAAADGLHRRFWRGFDLGSSDPETLSRYVDLLASGYGPYPRSSGPVVAGAAGGAPWCTTIFANRVEDIVDHQSSSCVDDGPRLRQFGVTSDHERDAPSGGGVLFRERAWMVVHFDIESPTPVERVTLFSGREPLRVWHPRSRDIRVAEPIFVARNHEFWLQAVTADGRQAISGRVQTQESTFRMGMCSDNQNSICSLARPPIRFERDERSQFLQHSYWHTGEAAGQLGVMRDASDLVPRIIETGIIQPVKSFAPSPVLRSPGAADENHVAGEMRILSADRDHNRVEYRCDPAEGRLRSRVTLTHFRPAAGGDTVVLVETEIEAKADVPAGELQHLRVALMPNLAPSWRHVRLAPQGITPAVPFDAVERGPLASDGGVMVWGNEICSLLVLPLDGRSYEAECRSITARNGREQVRLTSELDGFTRGSRMQTSFLVVLRQGAVSSPDALRSLRQEYAGVGHRVCRLRIGRMEASTYPATVAAVGGIAAGEVDTQGVTNPPPLVVSGIEPRFPCIKLEDGRATLLEPVGDTVRTVLAAGTKEFVVGNPIVCDDSAVRLEWGGVEDGSIRFHAHNPSSTTTTCRVRANSGFPDLPPCDEAVTLAPGESGWFGGR